MNKKKRSLKYIELSQLIITAIEQEQFFNKETLIPKIKALMNGFSLNINQTNYDRIKNPTDYNKAVRKIEILEQEKQYWKDIVNKIDGKNMPAYYAALPPTPVSPDAGEGKGQIPQEEKKVTCITLPHDEQCACRLCRPWMYGDGY